MPLTVEPLESRWVPTGLTYNNGPLLTRDGHGTHGPVAQPILDYCELHDLECGES